MKRRIALVLALLLAAWAPQARAGHTREEVRAAYRAIADWSETSPYAEAPVVRAPYAAGALTETATREALAWLNFIRWLAGLETPVRASAIYDYQCQRGAALLAALDRVDHQAPMPADMDRNFYDSAHLATTSSNLARFNWMRPGILREGVSYFVRDDGEANLPVLGHRRWALNPLMAATGFGLANSETGMSYVVMYAHDLGRIDAVWSTVCWPSEGAFPATLMHADLAWSIVLNPLAFDLEASNPVVTLSESGAGLRFSFRPAEGAGDGFCALNRDGYGAGPCLIFRPDLAEADFADYQQNQRWTVRVEGLVDPDGAPIPLEYAVEMIALRPVDPTGVELSSVEARLAPGGTLALAARVLPDYADDLSVRWLSTDLNVAYVDAGGRVTAVAPGTCEIIARTANGRWDACALTVEAAATNSP